MIDLEELGGLAFVLLAQMVYILLKNILDVVSVTLLVLMWRRLKWIGGCVTERPRGRGTAAPHARRSSGGYARSLPLGSASRQPQRSKAK